jgi:hypothetical protein
VEPWPDTPELGDDPMNEVRHILHIVIKGESVVATERLSAAA